MAWLPSYFELALGLNVQYSSLLTLIPYLAMTAMTPVVRFRPVRPSFIHVPAHQRHHRLIVSGLCKLTVAAASTCRSVQLLMAS